MATKRPIDCVGNELFVGNTVVLEMGMPVIWKIEVVENGGIDTPNGKTPALIRLVGDVTLRSIPGLPFRNVIRCVVPTEEDAVKKLSDMLGRA